MISFPSYYNGKQGKAETNTMQQTVQYHFVTQQQIIIITCMLTPTNR